MLRPVLCPPRRVWLVSRQHRGGLKQNRPWLAAAHVGPSDAPHRRTPARCCAQRIRAAAIRRRARSCSLCARWTILVSWTSRLEAAVVVFHLWFAWLSARIVI